MCWVARVVFGLRGVEEFVDAGLMVDDERSDFLESWDALIRLRNRLHYFSRRKNDQLYFELQEEVAEARRAAPPHLLPNAHATIRTNAPAATGPSVPRRDTSGIPRNRSGLARATSKRAPPVKPHRSARKPW